MAIMTREHVETSPSAPSPRATKREQRRQAAAQRKRAESTRSLLSDMQLARPRNRRIYFAVLAVTVTVFTGAFIFPVYWMVTGALKSPAEFTSNTPTFVPHSFHPETYSNAWNQMQIAHFFMNTVEITLGGWVIQMAVDVSVAYALSKLRPIFGKLIFGLM